MMIGPDAPAKPHWELRKQGPEKVGQEKSLRRVLFLRYSLGRKPVAQHNAGA